MPASEVLTDADLESEKEESLDYDKPEIIATIEEDSTQE